VKKGLSGADQPTEYYDDLPEGDAAVQDQEAIQNGSSAPSGSGAASPARQN
jgi:hypothetical protein